MKAIRSLCCVFAVSVIANFPFSVEAVPIDLGGGFTDLNGVTLFGALHADFSGGVLTLNSSAPLSTLSIDGIPTIPGQHLSDTESFAGITIQAGFDLAPVSFSAWNFALGGQFDFNSLLGTLTGIPQYPDTIFTLSGSFRPTLVATGGTFLARAAVQAALDVLDPTVNYTATGYWNFDTAYLLSPSFTTNGSQLQIGGEIQNVSFGSWDFGMSFDFGSAAGSQLADFIANDVIYPAASTYLQSAIDSVIVSESTALNDNGFGLDQFCRASGSSFMCTSNLVFSDTVDLAPPSEVPEPNTLIVFAFGLTLLGAMSHSVRRQRRLGLPTCGGGAQPFDVECCRAPGTEISQGKRLRR